MLEQHADQTKETYIWDAPLRLFHWGLVGAVTTSIAAGEFGFMNVHVISGHVVLGLILFRLVWGVIGGKHARFNDFLKKPAVVIAYAKKLISGDTPPHAGHNPMGGMSVIALLLTLSVQVGTGLFSNDDILTDGPLVPLVSKSTSDFLTSIHYLSGNVLYVLIILHLAAVAYYTFKGHPILAAMITGKTWGLPENQDTDSPKLRGSWVGAIVTAVLAAVVAYAIKNY